MHFGRWRHTRGQEHYRGEPDSALSGGYAPDSARAEGRSIVDEPGKCEPLCARIKGANREIFDGKADLSPRSVFFRRGPTRSGERVRFVGLWGGCTGLWSAGCWLTRRLIHQLKASITVELGISIFLSSV